MSKSDNALAQVQARAGHAPVSIGLILGSGLGHIADMVEGEAFDYAELEGFPVSAVSGHSAKLVVGQLWGQRVAVFGGRAHYYERGQADAMRVPLELLKALGRKSGDFDQRSRLLPARYPTRRFDVDLGSH